LGSLLLGGGEGKKIFVKKKKKITIFDLKILNSFGVA
jgi:hypothetical protein